MRTKREVPPESQTMGAPSISVVFDKLGYSCGRNGSLVLPAQMNVTLTEAAKAQMCTIVGDNDSVRYELRGGGCSGLMAHWGFGSPEDGDVTWDLGDGKSFVIDQYTIEYMEGATIDYGGDFMPAFKVGIPDRKSCGCGESFVATFRNDALVGE